MIKNFFIFSLLLLLSSCTQEPMKYLTIDKPVDSSSINPEQVLVIQGTGKGLYENNVVIEIEDLTGNTLIQMATTIETDEIRGAGLWKEGFTLAKPFPTAIKVSAFSPSPKEGEVAIKSQAILLNIPNPLQQTQWRLEQYLNESEQLIAVLPSTAITAEFNDEKIAGSAGCNRYFGRFKLIDQTGITFPSPMGSTMMACSPEISTQEQHYLKALSSVAVFQIQQQQLILLDQDKQVVLIYHYEPPISLENTRWQATGINNGRGGVVSAQNTHLVTIQFNDNKIQGHTGCNKFSASYESIDHKIKLGPVATTRKFCTEEGIYLLEKQFLHSLEQATVFEIKADQLKFKNDDGSLLLSFSRILCC